MDENLKNLLDAYLSPSPESALKTALGTVDDLPALIEAAKTKSEKMYEEFNSITDKEAKDAAAAEIKALTKVIKTAAAEHDRKIEAEAKKQQEAAAKAEVDEAFKSLKDLKLAEAPKVEAKPEGDDKPDTKTDAPSQSEDAPVAAKVETPAPQGEPVPAVTPVAETAPAAPQGELVGAGAGSGQFSAAGLPPQGALPPSVTQNGTYTNVFSVNSNGSSTGTKLTNGQEVVSALAEAYRLYDSRTPGNGIMHKVAQYRRPENTEFSVYGNSERDQEVIDKVASTPLEWDTSKGQFAAGWCAPEETLYELCPQISSDDGLVDLPTVTARRGSLQYTKGPRFGALYGNSAVGQVLTETQVEAATVKTCIEIDCPPFTTVTLDVNPLCVTGNLLTHAGYPEYEQRFISEVMSANQHKMNGIIIGRMVAASTVATVTAPPTTGPVDTSSASQVLDYLSLYATWLRQQERTRIDQIVEVGLPAWYRQHAAADLARRNGVDLLTGQARFDEALRSRFLRVQWLYDWQLIAPAAASAAEISAIATARQAVVQALVYLPGTFVKAVNPVINLGVMHSAAQLATNQYTALFVEEGFAVIERCWDSLAVNIPICPSGTTGAASGSCDVTP